MISATDINAEYEPIDLSGQLNAGVQILDGSVAPLIGARELRGIPFAIGGDPSRCFIATGLWMNGPVTVPVGGRASRLIFAHRLFDPRPADGTASDGELGGVVARYLVRLASGATIEIPIREHFEVANVPSRRKLFLAVDDGPPWLAPRHEGRWLDQFARREEIHLAGTRDYYLWDWINPEPATLIDAITLEPRGRRYLVAGITRSATAESPFPRDPAKVIRMSLRDADAASRDIGSLELVVDRGNATYPYPLPEALPAVDPPGWGEPAIRRAAVSYARVQAIPSATLRLRDGSGAIAAVTWRALAEQGRVTTDRATFEVIDRGRTWGRLQVVDADTGQRIAARVHIQSAEGVPYPPYGHHEQVNGYLFRLVGVDVGGDVRLGRTTHSYIPGACEGWLPRGEVVVDVARGFEYTPVRATFVVGAESPDLTVRLRRWTDMNARGWFSGDTHVHFQSIQQSHLEAQAEDLDIVNLLAAQLGHTFSNNEDFTGEPQVSKNGESVVFVSSENRSRDHICVLGVRTPVLPWSTGGPNVSELGGSVDETPAGWADAAHAAGGLVVLAHYSTYAQHEALALIATGRADAVEFYNQGPAGQAEYYDLLNAGYTLPLVGGTDKMANEVPVGLFRTYARVGGPSSFAAWLDAIRAGRTFMTSGPLLSLSVDGRDIGDTVRLAAGRDTVEVEARVDSIFPVNSLQVVVGGAVAAEATDANGAKHLVLKARVRIDRDTWIAARTGGSGYATNALRHHIEPPPPREKPIDFSKAIIAHTSPVYVTRGASWDAYDERVARFLLRSIDGGLEHLRTRATLDLAPSSSYAHGERDHLAYLERPYLQARAAIEKRIADHH
jgi:hypothetical protein